MASGVQVMVDTIEGTTESVVRIPANAMSLLRQSYDSRQKVLDWMLAIGVAGAMCWAFKAELRGFLTSPINVNTGRDDDIVPNMAVREARNFGDAGQGQYTYNLPASRALPFRVAPSGTRAPNNPSDAPSFPT